MRRGVGTSVGAVIAAALVAAAALAAAAPAKASVGAKYGIQDDAWIMYGPGALSDRIATLDRVGAQLVRFTLRWDAVAKKKPTNARNPDDPAYDWGTYGDVLDELHASHITVLVTLWGSPRWANGGGSPSRLPKSGLGNFATAAAKRFPWVHLWTVWNEPNSRTFSLPVSPKLYVRNALNPAYAALHAASRANKVAGGVTSPRKTPTGMSPLAFMQGMHAAHARLDAYAQNPYPVGRGETPTKRTCPNCFTMATLPTIRSNVSRYFGAKKPLWLTEYGYQTNPPDRLLGVSPANQALYGSEASLRVWKTPGVTILIQFLMQDEPSLGGWQSGLLTVRGGQKPYYHGFALPLAQVSRRGTRTVLWGEVRSGSGKRPYRLQRFTSSGWRTIGGTLKTGLNGAFQRTVAVKAGTRVRLLSPVSGWSSPAIRIT